MFGFRYPTCFTQSLLPNQKGLGSRLQKNYSTVPKTHFWNSKERPKNNPEISLKPRAVWASLEMNFWPSLVKSFLPFLFYSAGVRRAHTWGWMVAKKKTVQRIINLPFRCVHGPALEWAENNGYHLQNIRPRPGEEGVPRLVVWIPLKFVIRKCAWKWKRLCGGGDEGRDCEFHLTLKHISRAEVRVICVFGAANDDRGTVFCFIWRPMFDATLVTRITETY